MKYNKILRLVYLTNSLLILSVTSSKTGKIVAQGTIYDVGGASGYSIGNKGYMGTGRNGLKNDYKNSSYYLDDFWEYDTATDKWTEKAKFPGYARFEAAGFSINGKGYIGTGDWLYVWYDFFEYNPTTNSWTEKAKIGSGSVSIKRMDNRQGGGSLSQSYYRRSICKIHFKSNR